MISTRKGWRSPPVITPLWVKSGRWQRRSSLLRADSVETHRNIYFRWCGFPNKMQENRRGIRLHTGVINEADWCVVTQVFCTVASRRSRSYLVRSGRKKKRRIFFLFVFKLYKKNPHKMQHVIWRSSLFSSLELLTTIIIIVAQYHPSSCPWWWQLGCGTALRESWIEQSSHSIQRPQDLELGWMTTDSKVLCLGQL